MRLRLRVLVNSCISATDFFRLWHGVFVLIRSSLLVVEILNEVEAFFPTYVILEVSSTCAFAVVGSSLPVVPESLVK